MIEPVVINQITGVDASGKTIVFDSSNYFDGWYSPETLIYIFNPIQSEDGILGNPYHNLRNRFHIGGVWTEMKKDRHHLFCSFYDEEDYRRQYTFQVEFFLDERLPNEVLLVFHSYSNTIMCKNSIMNLMRRCGLELYRIM